jgi:hypothetical protein
MGWLTLRTAVIFGSLLVGGSVFGQQSVTVKGVTYVGAELIKEYPQSIYIKHASGKTFVKKNDLSADDAQALGITSPVADPFQQALDKDLRDLQAGKSHAPAAPTPAAQRPSTTPPVAAVLASRGNDAMNQWAQLGGVVGVEPEEMQDANKARSQRQVANGGRSQSSSGSTDPRRTQATALPNQRWMGTMDSSSVRLAMFTQGLLPLKESEARDLFSGREISPLSSRCALDAVKAAKVMLGLLGPEHLPQGYRKIARRSDPPTATARRTASVPFDPAIFPAGSVPAALPSGSSTSAAPSMISAAPAAPRFVNTHDSAGNFHTGVVQPTGFYNGTVHSPRGDVGHVTGHVSPIGSFHGTDNHGGFYHGH